MSLADRHCVRATKGGRAGKDTGGEEDPPAKGDLKKINLSQKDFRKKNKVSKFSLSKLGKGDCVCGCSGARDPTFCRKKGGVRGPSRR